jgi:predicted nucleic acid-binding protein
MIGLDTTVLTLLLNEKSDSPPDPATGKSVVRAKERIEFLITTLHKQKQQIIIPTPVLSEVLVRTGGDGLKYIEMLEKLTVFDVRDFNKLAAIELAIMHQQASKSGHKKGAQQDEPWQKIKIDRQIVAICKVAGVKTLYASDPGLAAFARTQKIDVFGVHDLPLPPENPQLSMKAALEASLTNQTANAPKPEDVDESAEEDDEIDKPD